MSSARIRYLGEIEKQVAERYSVTVDFSNRMPTGATLVSSTVAARSLPDETVVSNDVLSSTTATISGSTASVFAVAGTDGMRYRITFTATLSDTSILVEDIRMHVRNIRD